MGKDNVLIISDSIGYIKDFVRERDSEAIFYFDKAYATTGSTIYYFQEPNYSTDKLRGMHFSDCVILMSTYSEKVQEIVNDIYIPSTFMASATNVSYDDWGYYDNVVRADLDSVRIGEGYSETVTCDGYSWVVPDGYTLDTTILDELPNGCNHNWKMYHGFTEAYEYCTKCNEKKNESC